RSDRLDEPVGDRPQALEQTLAVALPPGRYPLPDSKNLLRRIRLIAHRGTTSCRRRYSVETTENRHTIRMDGDVVTRSGIVIPANAVTWRFSRGTGPGGQGVNTTDSRVELVVDLTAMGASDTIAERVREKLGDSLRIVVATERSQL